ncbi:MAG: hypothetical protein CM1200mP28_02130 [Deltaproteobacteria bacterium]|nr:MAG: hypothetical protein CM1200mP28_02130 [Deltaproteobacteria bacterium]
MKKPESADEDDTEYRKIPKFNFWSTGIQKTESSDEPENFDEELEDADQVKVTLSENVKILKELQGKKLMKFRMTILQ